MANKIFGPEKVFDFSGIENSLQNDQKNTRNNQQDDPLAFTGPSGAPVSASSGTSRVALMKNGSVVNPELEQLRPRE